MHDFVHVFCGTSSVSLVPRPISCAVCTDSVVLWTSTEVFNTQVDLFHNVSWSLRAVILLEWIPVMSHSSTFNRTGSYIHKVCTKINHNQVFIYIHTMYMHVQHTHNLVNPRKTRSKVENKKLGLLSFGCSTALPCLVISKTFLTLILLLHVHFISYMKSS